MQKIAQIQCNEKTIPIILQLVKVLFGSLLSFLMLNGIESACDYFQNLEAGQTYYVYNPGFPYKYKSANQCTWQMTSRYVTKINCSVDMPAFVVSLQITTLFEIYAQTLALIGNLQA